MIDVRVPDEQEGTKAVVRAWLKQPGDTVAVNDPLVELETDKVTQEASFIDDLGADSLDIVELVMAFEEEFGVEIPDDAAEKIATVGDATKYIEEHKG